MKTKLLLPFLTALVLTGCSNDDAPDNNGGGSANGETSYLAVNIVTPKDVVGRDITSGTSDGGSTTDGGFEYGTDDENTAESATFILIDDQNNVFQVSKNVTLKLGSTSTDNPASNVEKISDALIVVPGSKEKLNITGILAILNAPDLDIPKNTPLSTITDFLGNYATAELTSKGKFIMSNSAHIDKDGKTIIAQPVSQSDFDTDPDVAKGKAISIYVERVVAKIETEAVTNTTEFNKGTTVKLEGSTTDKNLTIDIKGIQIANCTTQSYLFKNINDLTATGTTAPWDGWNSADNHRSYWAAKTVGSDITDYSTNYFANNSWHEISGMKTDGTVIETNQPGAAKQLNAKHKFYVQENINQNYKTSVIVTAQLKDGNDPFEFVRIAGLYYSKDDGLKHIASVLASRSYKFKGANDQIKDFSADCIEWSSELLSGKKDWIGYAKIKTDYKNDNTFFVYDASYTATTDHLKPVPLNDITNILQEPQLLALFWKNGMCYYFAEIEHFGTITTGEGENATTVKRNGIIRNHIYKLTLNSIGGLGVPVINPDKPIIPERPGDDESLFYLAAKVNILSWKVVSQGVDLK